MKKMLFVLAILLLLALGCVPQAEKPTEEAPAVVTEPAEEDNKLDEVIEKVGDLVDTITKKESTEESAPEPQEAVEVPKSRKIAESNPIVRVDDLPQPILKLNMDNDPTTSEEYIEVRKGAIRSDFDQGIVGRAWKFDGRDDYIVTSFGELKTLDTFTFVIWVKPGDLKKRSHIIWQGFEDIGTRGEFAANGWGPEQELHLSNGDELSLGKYAKEKITFYFGDKEKHLKLTAPMSNFDWQHVAVVVEDVGSDARAEMYLDGHSVGKSSVNGAIARDTWGRLFFGKAAKDGPQGDSDRDFAGMLDEFAIYDQALSADEIAKLCRRQNDGQVCNGLS